VAIYHLTAKVISRARGQSVVAAAAYRFGVALRDERYGITHRFPGERGVAHAEIMAPAGSPSWAADRDQLWNRVEEGERRKDAQLARVVEIALPIELSPPENLALVREYVAGEFVARGMIADFCLRGDSANPHAHILLTLRPVTPEGFGLKDRGWNGRAVLQQWRAAWAERVNDHLARAGHGVRIDHRTLEAQQIELAPARRVGVSRERRDDEALPSHLAERILRQQRVAQANGEIILEDPTVVLRAVTHQRPIFTERELAAFLRPRTHGEAQFDAVLARVFASPEIVALGTRDGSEARFTSRDMVEAEKSLLRRIASMAARRQSGAADSSSAAPSPESLSEADRRTFDHLGGAGQAKAAVLEPGPGKATLLTAIHRMWTSAGLLVQGAAPSARAAQELEQYSGIASTTLESREEAWSKGLDLARNTVLVIDGAENIGLKQLERVVAVADRARSTIVLLGDAAHLRALKAEPPLVSVLRLDLGGRSVS
jgi:Ti-type conjugative transfer relaxase TraA